MTSINPKLLKDFLNELYPIGKTEIFLDNEDHSNYMGFTWQRDAVGRAIVGIDANDTDFNAIGKTGGSKELQEHTHNIPLATGGSIGAEGLSDRSARMKNATQVDVDNFKTTSSGTGNSGNLQPYKVFAIWVRTA